MPGSRMRADRMALDYFRVCLMLRSAVVYYERCRPKEYRQELSCAVKSVDELKKDTAGIADLKEYYELEGPEIFDPIIDKLKGEKVADASPEVTTLMKSVEGQVRKPKAFCNALP